MSWHNAPRLQKLTAAKNAGNRGAQIWGLDGTGKLYTTYQKSPGGEWSNWMGPEWAPINHPKNIYELAACQLADNRLSLWVLDMKREIWHVDQESPGGNWSHWWHSTSFKGRWNNSPAPFKKIAVTHSAKAAGSLADVPGGAMFIGLKEDGLLAVCYNTGSAWSRFRNDWHGPPQGARFIEVTACQQGDNRVAIWGLDENRQLWGTFEATAGHFDFGDWIGPNWQGAPKLRNIAAVEGSNGAIIIGQDEDYRLVTNFQSTPGSNTWGRWSSPNWANAPQSYELTAAGQNNGLAQIWAVTLRQKLTSIAQRDATHWPDSWSDRDDDPYPDPPLKP